MKCIGNSFDNQMCIDLYCIMFPNSPHCNGGNACEKDDQSLTGFCEDCCEIKSICEQITGDWTIIGALKAYVNNVKCDMVCALCGK